jgi:hypothetical protein
VSVESGQLRVWRKPIELDGQMILVMNRVTAADDGFTLRRPGWWVIRNGKLEWFYAHEIMKGTEVICESR